MDTGGRSGLNLAIADRAQGPRLELVMIGATRGEPPVGVSWSHPPTDINPPAAKVGRLRHAEVSR